MRLGFSVPISLNKAKYQGRLSHGSPIHLRIGLHDGFLRALTGYLEVDVQLISRNHPVSKCNSENLPEFRIAPEVVLVTQEKWCGLFKFFQNQNAGHNR